MLVIHMIIARRIPVRLKHHGIAPGGHGDPVNGCLRHLLIRHFTIRGGVEQADIALSITGNEPLAAVFRLQTGDGHALDQG